ncbi:hypothetical protein M9Y10_011839 [Tritrichomonas musculus]|uniref:Importin N-terminal domain-containing protein n=1 Tax=Tritrichomonas musculus TaxID=1915356 RepID=A0ABR2IDH1_9EUKA
MEQLFDQIKLLTKQKRLIPAEEVITRTIISFEEVLPPTLTDSEIEKYEEILLGLLYVNSGQVSLQCAIRIATCLISLYNKQQTPKLWNIFTAVTRKPTTTGILVIGHVIDKVGEHSRSMIPGLVKILVSQNYDQFASLFALNSSFKRAYNELKAYSEKAFQLVKKSFQTSQLQQQNNPNSKEEASQLIAIQLLVSVYSTETISQKKIFSFLNEILSTSNIYNYSTFVIDQIYYFIAFCAYYPLKDKQKLSSKINDWDIGGSSKGNTDSDSLFDTTLEILSQYKSIHFSSIFSHFLDFLTPNFVFNNISLLFNFVRKTQPSEISQLLYLFGHDIRGELFDEIAAEQPPSSQQQRILRSLSFDDNTTNEIAALSLQLTASESSTERLYGASFFSLLADKNPQSAETYLNMSVLYLSTPPEDNPTLDRDIYGMALIASHIIGATHEKRRAALIDSVSSNLNLFLSRSYETKNVFSADFISTFMLLAVLPPSYVNQEKCARLLTLFNDKYKSTPSLSNNNNNIEININGGNVNVNSLSSNEKRLRNCAQYISSFLATHPKIDGNRRFLEVISQNPSLQNLTTTYCLIVAATEASIANTVMLNYFIPQILKTNPQRNYVLSLLRTPMMNSQELLHYTKFEAVHSDIVYFEFTESYFAFKSIDFFPNLILSLDETFVMLCLTEMLSNQTLFQSNPLMCHCLLLSLLKNASTHTYIPPNLNQLILHTIDDSVTSRLLQSNGGTVASSNSNSNNGENVKDSLLRVQVTAECAAIWASLSEEILQEMMSFLASIDGVGKCFLFVSLFNHIQLGDTTVINALHDLNELSKVPLICPYALYALSTVFTVYSLRLVELAVADMQFPFLLSIIHNNQLSLSPFNLYYISNAFVKLLPIISPEIKGSIAEPYVKLLIQCFCNTPIPCSSQIMFHTLRFTFAFAKEFIDTKEMYFPLQPGTSTSAQIAACGAFSDMLKVRCSYGNNNNGNFFFNLLPDLLILLQKRYDASIVDFIVAIALHFVELKDNITFKQIQTWTRIVKSVLSTNSLPDLQIEVSLPVKRVCSFICIQIIQVLQAFTQRNINENKDITRNKDDVFEFPTEDFESGSMNNIETSQNSTSTTSPSSFFNECLDDLMASSARAIETEDTEIMVNTYNFLNDILLKFKDKKTVNDLPLLELYDSQFAIAIRLGFVSSSNSPASLSSTFANVKSSNNNQKKSSDNDCFIPTGQFLIIYLSFHTKNLIDKPENFLTVLNGYFSGLESINEIIEKDEKTVKEKRVDAFYNIISKISNIARLNKMVFDKFKNLLPMFEQELSTLITESITTLTPSESSSSKVSVSLFRKSKSSFYGEYLVAFIWLHSILHQKQEENNEDSIMNNLIEFLSNEIQNIDTEDWRKSASVEAITCFIEYNNSSQTETEAESESKAELVEKAVKAVLTLKENHHDMFIKIIPRFLKAVSCFSIAYNNKNESSKNNLFQRGGALWKTILDLALEKDCFNCSTIAALIGRNPQDEIKSDDSNKTIENIVTKIFENGKSDDLTMALLTVLIRSSWEIQLKSIFRSSFDNNFKMKLLTRILKNVTFQNIKNSQINGYYIQFAAAFFKMFKRGGMNQLASIIIDNPSVGFAILNVDHFKRICDLCLSDVQYSPIFLQFILLSLEECGESFINDYNENKENSSLHALMRSAMNCVVSLGSDPQKGREVVDISIRIVNSINSILSSLDKNEDNLLLMKNVFDELSQREQQILSQLTEKQADKVKSRQNALNLKQFSEKPLKKIKKSFDDDGEKRIGGISSDDDEEWETLETDDK